MPDNGMSWGDFQKDRIFKGGYGRLRNWKEDGDIEVWIHTASQFFKRLFILIPYVGVKEDEKTGREIETIMYFPYVSHEEIEDYVNRKRNKQYYRCPLFRFIDWLEDNGHIGDEETVFSVSIGDRKRDRICTKADFVGDKDLGDWRLNMKPSLQYVMAVIDNKNVNDGVVIAAEKFSLGEAIKRAVRQEIDRKGPELGDPGQNPYCFKWVFDSSARTPADYYQAYPLERVELTDEIRELLDGEGLDLTEQILPGDPVFLRKILEEHVTIEDVPWDDLFDNIHEEHATFGRKDDNDEEEETPPKKPPKRAGGRKKPARKPTPPPEPENEEVEEEEVEEEEIEEETTEDVEDEGNWIDCPSCKGTGKKRGRKCKVCNGEGQIESPDDDEETEEEPKPEPPPKKRQRRARKPAPPPEPDPEPEDEEEMDECGGCGKSIPFDANECPHCGVTFE